MWGKFTVASEAVHDGIRTSSVVVVNGWRAESVKRKSTRRAVVGRMISDIDGHT